MAEFLAVLCAGWWVVAGGPVRDPLPPRIAAEVERLQGHRVAVSDAGYVIEDIAGEGPPIVGVVERRGEALVLAGEDGVAYRLVGVLARPRIAGPGYKIWALGEVSGEPSMRVLRARRIGVLAPPVARPDSR